MTNIEITIATILRITNAPPERQFAGGNATAFTSSKFCESRMQMNDRTVKIHDSIGAPLQGLAAPTRVAQVPWARYIACAG